jgi:hypothetical protein
MALIGGFAAERLFIRRLPELAPRGLDTVDAVVSAQEGCPLLLTVKPP